MAFTSNRGHGYPAPENAFDFTNAYLGAAAGNWTSNRGLGYPAPANDFDFTNAPTDPGGDIESVSSDIDCGLQITIAAIDQWEVIGQAYCPVSVSVGSDIDAGAIDDVVGRFLVVMPPASQYTAWMDQ